TGLLHGCRRAARRNSTRLRDSDRRHPHGRQARRARGPTGKACGRAVGRARGGCAVMTFLRRRKEGRASPWAFFKDFPRVMHYLKPHKGLAAASLSLVAGGSAMALLAPWPLAILIDTVLGNKPL